MTQLVASETRLKKYSKYIYLTLIAAILLSGGCGEGATHMPESSGALELALDPPVLLPEVSVHAASPSDIPAQVAVPYTWEWAIEGKFQRLDPTIPVPWPPAVNFGARRVILRFETEVSPLAVEVRSFDSVGSDGQPGDGAGQTLVKCGPIDSDAKPCDLPIVANAAVLELPLSPSQAGHEFFTVFATWSVTRDYLQRSGAPVDQLERAGELYGSWLLRLQV